MTTHPSIQYFIMSNKFTPPTPDEIREWQKQNGLTDAQCADMAGLSAPQNWRKYKSIGTTNRTISYSVWFTVNAKLELAQSELNRLP